MKRVFLALARWGLLAGVTIFGACGGGNDEPAATQVAASTTRESASALEISMDRSRIDIAGFSGSGDSTGQYITFTLNRGAGTYYATAVPDRPALLRTSVQTNSDRSISVYVDSVDKAVGIARGSITFKLCSDAACNAVTWQQSVPYQIAMLAVEPAPLELQSLERGSAAGTLKVSPPEGAALLQIKAHAEEGTWLAAVRAATGAITVSATAGDLAPGAYNGQVSLAFKGLAEVHPKLVPVAYTVGAGMIAPASRRIAWRQGSTAENTRSTVHVGFRGKFAPSWVAVSDQPWLVLSDARGKGEGSLGYAVDVERLAALPNRAVSTAHLAIRANGLAARTVDVTLDKQLAEIVSVLPNPVESGAAATVRVRGTGFTALRSAGHFSLGGVGALQASVLSDNEALVTVPALTRGRRHLTADNAAGVPTADVLLTVADAQTPLYASLTDVGVKAALIVDATRHAVYAVNTTRQALVRFQRKGAAWEIDRLPIASIGNIALSPDKRVLYANSGVKSMVAIDADDFTVQERHAAPADMALALQGGAGWQRGFAVTADRRLWFGGPQSSLAKFFDMPTGTFGTSLNLLGGTDVRFLNGAYFRAPEDGGYMLVTQNNGSATPLRYDPRLGLAASFDRLPITRVLDVFSAHGRRALYAGSSVYDVNSGRLLGSSQPSTNAFISSATLSADGRRVYALLHSNETGKLDRIEVFDVDRLVSGTGRFVSRGTITIPDEVANCARLAETDCYGSIVAVSPRGDELYWLSPRQLVVLPIPEALQPGQSTAMAYHLLPAAAR